MKIKKVVIFGGAHGQEQYLKLGYEVGKLLAENGFISITGGGPGIMREVNRGAFEAGGKSFGICIKYEEEQLFTWFTHHEMHDEFNKRHQTLVGYGEAFVVLPGGLGTIMEALEITQKKKFHEISMNVPLVFVGDYYQPMLLLFAEIAKKGFIKEPLDKLYQYAENPKELIAIFTNH